MRIFFIGSIMITMLQMSLIAQINSGSVVYMQVSNINTEGMPPQMVANMPKSTENSMQLLFNKTESLYQKNPNFKEDVDPNDNRPRFFKRMREMAVSTYYKDKNNKKLVEQASFFGKDFLVESELSDLKWKISAGEQKSILGYTCMKAYYKDSLQNLVAYFTPQIPVSQGPDVYGGLPGLILEIQSANVHILATEVKPGEITIKQPDKGKKMTKEEYEKMKQEKIKEQAEMRGGQGRPGMFFGH